MDSISFGRCGNRVYDNFSQKEIVTYLQSLKETDLMKLHQMFEQYIKSEFHMFENCSCESNDIGKIFAQCIGDSFLLGGWTGLHVAVSDDNPRFKKQAIDTFAVSFPGLLFTPNNKGQTPLMLASRMNANICSYLIEAFVKTSDDKNRAKFCTDSGESILTSSFDLKEQRKIVDDADDTSIYLIKNLYDEKIDIITLKKAICSKNCPNEVIVDMSGYLSGSIDLKQLSDVVAKLVMKADMDVSQFRRILNKVESVSSHSFTCHKEMYTKDFNILKELAKTVKRGEGQTTSILFSSFFTNFLKYSNSCVCPGDQKNIAHFACQEDNVFLLEILAKKFQAEFSKMMTQYDSDNKRPVYYCRKPIQMAEKLCRLIDQPEIWMFLCRDNKYNIVHQILKRSVAVKDLKLFFGLDSNLLTMLLQNCNSNSDSALHLMLRVRCKSSLLEMMVGKFKELNIPVDVKNDKGMTPLFILCSFLNRYDGLDQPMKLVDILLNADASQNIIIGPEVLSQMSTPGKLITAEWLARMSVLSSEEPETFSADFDKLLSRIKRSPEFEDGEFEADNELFEKLRSHDLIKYSHQHFKIINLIGPYNCDQFPDHSIVCSYRTIENLYYCALQLQHSRSTTYIHKTCDIHNDYSVIVDEGDVPSCIQHQKNKLQPLSKKQINLLTLLKSKMGLAYLHLPADMNTPQSADPEQDVSYLLADASISEELGYDLGALYQDLDVLSEIGLIRVVKVEEEVYVMNMPSALEQTNNELVQKLLFCSGIPTNIYVQDTTKESKSEEVLFDITIGSTGTETASEYMLRPFSDMLAYLLSGKLARKDSSCYSVLLTGKNRIQLEADKKILSVSTNNGSLKGRVVYAAKIAIQHLNHGNLGSVKDENNIALRLPDSPDTLPASSTTDPLLPGNEGEGNPETQSNVQIEKKLNTNMGKLEVGYLRILFLRMTDDRSIRIPVDDSRAPLKSDIPTVKQMRLYSELVSDNKDRNLIDFYNAARKDPKNERFCEALLNVLGLEEDHMKTRLDSCQDNAWWVVTAIVAGIILLVTVVTSVLYDVDAGFGGVAGVPLVFIASYFFKRILVRDEQTGKFKPWKDQEILRQCKGCMA